MRNGSISLMMAASSIFVAGCGVAGVATDIALADALTEAVTGAVTEALVAEITDQIDPPAGQVPGGGAVAEAVNVVEELVGALVAEVVVAPDVPDDSVTVTLVNDSPSYAVEVTVAYDDHILPLVWFGLASEKTFVLGPGETVSFWEDCDDLRTVLIDDADLLLPGGRNRETESDLLNYGLDYECDDEIRFVFDHADEGHGFDVSIAILSRDAPPHASLQDSIVDLFDD